MSAETTARRERLDAALAAAGLDAAAVTRPELLFWLAGIEPYPGDAAALLIRGDRALLVWPGDPPEGLAEGIDVTAYDAYASARGGDDGFAAQAAAAADALRFGGCHVGLDAGARPLWLRGDGVPACELFADLTRSKSAAEVAAIETGLAGNDAAFRSVAERFGPGASDFDVLDWCCSALARAAGTPVAYAGNIGLGARGDFFDAQPGGAVAAPGDSLFIDLYCRIGHYVADSTRCFSAGRAPAWLRAAHDRLERALDALAPDIRPGAVAGDLDRRCRELLHDGGAGGVFPHHTGHGAGLRAHGPPYLVPGSRDTLRAGDVVCVEPGLYFAGRGGARLEEVFLVTDDGARPLTEFPRTLSECPSGQVRWS